MAVEGSHVRVDKVDEVDNPVSSVQMCKYEGLLKVYYYYICSIANYMPSTVVFS